jgi:mycofactocin glycosyltransferase
MTARKSLTHVPTVPPPSNLHVRIDPAALLLDGGRVLFGGSPIRLVRLRPAAAALMTSWHVHGRVGDDDSARLLARRLLEAGILLPDPAPGSTQSLVVIVPVHGRAQQLRRCLEAIQHTAPEAAMLVLMTARRIPTQSQLQPRSTEPAWFAT